MNMGPMGRQPSSDTMMMKDTGRSLKKMVVSTKRYWPAFIIAIAFLLTGVILAVISPNYLSDLANEIVNHAATQSIDMDVITRLAIILSIFYVSSAFADYCAAFIITTVTQHYANDLRRKISDKINVLPLRYFDKTQIGDILSRITNDVDSLSQSLDSAVSMIISAIFMVVGSLIGMFCTSWQMALSALASVPLMIIFLLIFMKLGMPQFVKRQEKIGRVNAVVEEKFSGQLIIKLFNAESRQDKVFDAVNEDLGKTMFMAQFFGGLMMPMMSFISYATYAIVMTAGGLMIANQVAGVTLGTITAFMVYVRLFQSPVVQIAQALNTLQTAGAASKRVFDFLGEKEEEPENDRPYRFFNPETGKEKVQGEVAFHDVSFSYDQGHEIIHDFNATVKPGSKVAIVGPTGAGKTTMVNLLMRFYDVDKGSITIDGVDIKTLSRSELRELFGMVLQDTWVYDGTLRENIVYNTKNVSDADLTKAIKKANLSHFVNTLPDGVDCYIPDADSISAGQKQLITISRAMLRHTPMMILDEATSNVDTRTEEQIQMAMDELTKGKTSFVIAHRLSTIRNADLILVMRDGNIVETGTHESLMAQNGFYASLYNSQFAFE